MKLMYVLLAGCLIFSTSCSIREREQALEKRADELNQKEQQLLLKEKQLQLKEEELLAQQKLIDSTLLIDTLLPVDSSMLGTWTVQMKCTETNCPGSAVGDVRTIVWEIAVQDRNLIAKAFDNKKLARIYTGKFTENGAQLTYHPESEPVDANRNITVTLQRPVEGKINGRREIIGVNQCKIIYDLEMRKQ